MRNQSSFFSYLFLLSLSVLTLNACASSGGQQTAEAGDIQDPFESANRAIFAFNDALDDTLIHPVAKSYRAAVPTPARTGVRNFLRNIKTPIVFANQALQGDVDGAGTALLRGVINTTVGLGGLFDVADAGGLKYEQEDFGQTLAVWGIGNGPYLVAPIIGPSSVRDYAGHFIDGYADPLRWYLHNTDEEGWYMAKIGGDYLDLRESLVDVLGELEASSIDYYAAVRSTYYQRREALIRDNASAIADFDDTADL